MRRRAAVGRGARRARRGARPARDTDWRRSSGIGARALKRYATRRFDLAAIAARTPEEIERLAAPPLLERACAAPSRACARSTPIASASSRNAEASIRVRAALDEAEQLGAKLDAGRSAAVIEQLGIDGFAHPWMLPLALGRGARRRDRCGAARACRAPVAGVARGAAAGLRRRELGRGIAIAARGSRLALLGVALAGPVREHRAPPPPGLGLDLLLVVDTSESMQALDAELGGAYRTRLELAREVVARFAARRIEDGDRVGLVVFGETAFTQSPLSSDGRLLEAALGRTRPGMAGGATALGDALALAVKRVTALEPGGGGPGSGRLVVLLTDGRHNAGAIPPDVAAGLAAQRGVRVHTVGIGGEGEVAMARPGARGASRPAPRAPRSRSGHARGDRGRHGRALLRGPALERPRSRLRLDRRARARPPPGAAATPAGAASRALPGRSRGRRRTRAALRPRPGCGGFREPASRAPGVGGAGGARGARARCAGRRILAARATPRAASAGLGALGLAGPARRRRRRAGGARRDAARAARAARRLAQRAHTRHRGGRRAARRRLPQHGRARRAALASHRAPARSSPTPSPGSAPRIAWRWRRSRVAASCSPR